MQTLSSLRGITKQKRDNLQLRKREHTKEARTVHKKKAEMYAIIIIIIIIKTILDIQAAQLTLVSPRGSHGEAGEGKGRGGDDRPWLG